LITIGTSILKIFRLINLFWYFVSSPSLSPFPFPSFPLAPAKQGEGEKGKEGRAAKQGSAKQEMLAFEKLPLVCEARAGKKQPCPPKGCL
jgi:hypothetical protein